MHVVPIELDTPGAGAPAALNAPADALATLNTHDLPTLAAYVEGHDLALRRRLGFLQAAQLEAAQAERRSHVETLAQALGCAATAPALLRALLEHLATGQAPLLLVNLEDLWLEPEPQNVPGTTTEHPNWRRAAACTLETMDAEPTSWLTAALGSRKQRT